MYDTSLFVDKVETPAYVVDEACLLANLQILDGVRKRTGAKILLAQKAFSIWTEHLPVDFMKQSLEKSIWEIGRCMCTHLHLK